MSKLQKYNLLELPWTDVAEYLKAGNDAVMIPVGSCEKHGHHVPLGVDSYTTMGSVERAALKAKVLYAPLLPFGVSPHHMGEPGWGTGTISFPTEVYRDVLYAIGRSLIFAGFNKLVYVSHHGTNMGAQGDALRTLRAETGCFCAYYKTPTERECAVVADLMDGPPEETPGWHAGELETSTTIAYMKEKGIYEGSVFMERAKADRAHAPGGWDLLFPKRMAPTPSSSRILKTSSSRCFTMSTRIRPRSETRYGPVKNRAMPSSRGSPIIWPLFWRK